MKLLICTDGTPNSLQIADLIVKLNYKTDNQITLLGVSESKYDMDQIESSMNQIDQFLHSKYSVNRMLRHGNPIEEIMTEVLEGEYDLVAVGAGEKQLGLLNPRLGSTTSKLARKLDTHFLVARNVPKIIKKVLFCTGAEAPASKTMTLGGEWISNTDVRVGLLHVLPVAEKKQVIEAKAEKPASVENERQDLIISQATQQLRSVGITNEIVPRIRQGLVVEEISAELTEGEYDLLVVGAHYQPDQDRWQGTLLDDITDQLLHRCSCSVLIV
jgi:nucleotide-binding universal stress UspA family protein